jgi:hypothetical protein
MAQTCLAKRSPLESSGRHRRSTPLPPPRHRLHWWRRARWAAEHGVPSDHAAGGQMVRVLSFNMCLRPPRVRSSAHDYKDARLLRFIQDYLTTYDILGTCAPPRRTAARARRS